MVNSGEERSDLRNNSRSANEKKYCSRMASWGRLQVKRPSLFGLQKPNHELNQVLVPVFVLWGVR
jgi:hypothetical protein